jgi:hypothetical protein
MAAVGSSILAGSIRTTLSRVILADLFTTVADVLADVLADLRALFLKRAVAVLGAAVEEIRQMAGVFL